MRVSPAAIGQNIKRARQESNLSQQEAAELMHISFLYFCRLERGERPISLEMLTQLASALNCSVSALLANALTLSLPATNNYADG